VDVTATNGNSFESDCTGFTAAPTTSADVDGAGPMPSQPPTTTTNPPPPPPVVLVDVDCEIKDGTGKMVVIEHGASFGALAEGKCGFAEERSSFCNKKRPTIPTIHHRKRRIHYINLLTSGGA